MADGALREGDVLRRRESRSWDEINTDQHHRIRALGADQTGAPKTTLFDTLGASHSTK